jgi:acyl-CoA dehydrogenase family protein 10
MSSTSDMAGDVRHALDVERLAAYLRSHVRPFDGELRVRQFAHGQSNPTYLLTCGREFECVLRKQPHGKLLPTAHDVHREYRVMSALRTTSVPVPEMLAFCTDASVVGTPFYVMEFVHGRVFKDATLAELKPAERYGVYAAMCEVLSRIHRVDVGAVGLSDLGVPDAYAQRQVRAAGAGRTRRRMCEASAKRAQTRRRLAPI